MRVFISHGIAADDAAGDAFLTRLYEALHRPDDHLVGFLDRQRQCLPLGALWRTTLHEELARCGAGVIVLSTRALQSDWVKKEAAILSWRRALEVDPAFHLRIVILDGLTEADLQRAGLGPMQLTEIQALRCGGAEAEIAQAIDSARDDLLALAATLAPRADYTPLDWLRDYLSTRLGKGIDPTLLHSLARDVNDGADPAADGVAAKLLLRDRLAPAECAEAIAAALLRNGFGKTGSLTGFMTRLDRLAVSLEHRRDIFDAVSALWVDPQCAAPFHPRLGPARPARTAYIALLRPGTESAKFETSTLARRANPQRGRPQVVCVARPRDPNRLTEAVIGKVFDHFLAKPGHSYDDDITPERLMGKLAALDTPIYVVMKFALDEQQLEALFAELPGFLYVGLDAEAPTTFDEFQWRRVSGWRQPDELAARSKEYDDIMLASGF